MDPFTATVTADPNLSLNLEWMAVGEPIELDVESALTNRGARVTMITCASYGAS